MTSSALLAIYLNHNYQDYLSGAEVERVVNALNHKLEPGQHILVFEDEFDSLANITIPAGEGAKEKSIEGTITQVSRIKDMKSGETTLQLRLKRL